MAKSPKIIQVLNQISGKMFGRSRSECLEKRICIACGGPADSFRDNLSEKEYFISVLCNKCQDEIFNAE